MMSCAIPCQRLATQASHAVVLPALKTIHLQRPTPTAPTKQHGLASKSCSNKSGKTALKSQYVDGLVSTTAFILSSIWPYPHNSSKPIASLPKFLHHLLSHSRTTHSTLQLALLYLFRIKPAVISADKTHYDAEYISCGRRIFLACLMTAHKYLMDRTYKNVAWAKVSGLPVSEVNRAERVVLELLDWRLGVAPDAWSQWCKMIEIHVHHRTGENKLNYPMVDLSMATTPKIDGFLLCQTEPRTMADLSITVMSQDDHLKPIHPDSAVVMACEGFSPPESKKRKADHHNSLPSPKRSR
ncbi:cyclin-domain-containing protein [Umbelopsis sp. PMI_123]|nr:cyclin-domain-containing protein [Umbelopsis sp. PMI_123]